MQSGSLGFLPIAATAAPAHALDIQFLKEVDPDVSDLNGSGMMRVTKLFLSSSMQKSKFAVRDRVIEFALEKAEDGPYWERLTKDKTKQHWLKVDFNKWKDEDESDEEAGGGDLEEVSEMNLIIHILGQS